jgi:glycosyltransferase involved in cell wall biosynthesis
LADLSVISQDPRFGGGARAQTEAFWRGAAELGREPRLFYVAQPGLQGVAPGGPLPAGTAAEGVARGLESLNQLVGGHRLARLLPPEGPLWVCAAAASHGYAAVRSARPFGCWIGTSLDEEWRARMQGLPRSRRLALRLNAPLLRRFERDVLRRAAVVCATSPWSRRALAAAGELRGERVRILPIPVDAELFAPAPDEVWQAGLERPTIVFVGRGDDPRKNVALLLAAFQRVRDELPRIRLRLVGTPPAGALGDAVEVRAATPSVPDAIHDAALFVLPSLQEGFAIVAAEALACGVPVLSTPCGGPEELLRSSGGGRVLAGFTVRELADAAIEHLSDPVTLAAMRRRGRDHVLREHSPERFRELLAPALAELDGAS